MRGGLTLDVEAGAGGGGDAGMQLQRKDSRGVCGAEEAALRAALAPPRPAPLSALLLGADVDEAGAEAHLALSSGVESDEAARALWAMTPKPMPLQLAGGAIDAAQEGDRLSSRARLDPDGDPPPELALQRQASRGCDGDEQHALARAIEQATGE